MLSNSELQLFYKLGSLWATEHLDTLLHFSDSRTNFEEKAHFAFETLGVPEGFSARVYAHYSKNPRLAEDKFVEGAWDTLKGHSGNREGVPSN